MLTVPGRYLSPAARTLLPLLRAVGRDMPKGDPPDAVPGLARAPAPRRGSLTGRNGANKR